MNCPYYKTSYIFDHEKRNYIADLFSLAACSESMDLFADEFTTTSNANAQQEIRRPEVEEAE